MPETRSSPLLVLDAAINLVLGTLLIAFPESVVTALGVPPAEPAFYPSILGGVLVGIGVALALEQRRQRRGREGASGLGLLGAVAINLCGGIVLAGWLLFGRLELPFRGVVFLWVLVTVLLGLSGAELLHQMPVSEGAQGRSRPNNELPATDVDTTDA